MGTAHLHATARNLPDALAPVDLRPGRVSPLSETRSREDDEENGELDRRVDGQHLPLLHHLASLGVAETRPMVQNLPNLGQQPLESNSRIVGPVLFDDGSFQDVPEVLAQDGPCTVAPIPKGNDDFADIREGDCGDSLVADHGEHVLIEAPAPAGLGGLPVPPLAAYLGGNLVNATEGGPLLPDGLEPGVTAGANVAYAPAGELYCGPCRSECKGEDEGPALVRSR